MFGTGIFVSPLNGTKLQILNPKSPNFHKYFLLFLTHGSVIALLKPVSFKRAFIQMRCRVLRALDRHKNENSYT